MNVELELDILSERMEDDININGAEFKEFCNNVNMLDFIVTPELYIEALVDNNKSFMDKIPLKKPLKDTRKTTRDLTRAYGDVTDGSATLIKSTWNMSMKALNLATKISTYILSNLAKIPNMIVATAETIHRIPVHVRNKIRGNINLYITINDINNLNKQLIPLIDTFLEAAQNMSKGDMWGTFFRRRPIGEGSISKHVLTENDMAYNKKMKSTYEKLKLINFKESVVKFEHQNVVDTYFGDTKSIKYKNSSGETVTSNYYDALINIFDDFQGQREFLEKVKKDMGIKMDKSQMNSSFARLDEKSQKVISESITMISKVITIIGNFIKCVMMDFKTINKSINKILSKHDVKLTKMQKPVI